MLQPSEHDYVAPLSDGRDDPRNFRPHRPVM
jgi:hypothetical protein